MSNKNRVTTILETITPAKAREWLQKNSNNRPIRKGKVESLARAIMNGEWMVNGETIKFNDRDQLADGQHRLLAAIKADKTIMSYVVRGISAKAFDTIDRGIPRSNSDLLDRKGYTNCNTLAAALTWLLKDENKALRNTGESRICPSGQQIITEAERHPAMSESISATHGARRFLSHAVAAFCHYQFSRIDKLKADAFFGMLASGENMKRGEPIYELRERLMGNKGCVYKLSSISLIAVVRKAWNAWTHNRTIRCLKWSLEEEITEIEK